MKIKGLVIFGLIIAVMAMMVIVPGCTPVAAPPTTAAAETAAAETAAATTAAAETTAAPKGDTTIGFSSAGRFSLALIAGEVYLRTFAEEKGWIFITAIAENDAAKQAQDIEDLLARNVDLVEIMAVDSKAIISSIQSVHAAGLKAVGYMRPQDPNGADKYDGFAGQDTVAQAYDGAIELSKLMDADGVKPADVKALHIVGDPKDENALKRKEGFEKAAKELGWTIAAEVTCDGWNLDKALTGATNALEADKGINVVLLASDYLWPGVKTALQNQGMLKKAGEAGHVYVASQDVFPIAVDDIKAGYIDTSCVLDMGGMAKIATDMAERLLNGEVFDDTTTPKQFNWMAAPVVTLANIDTTPNLWGVEFHP